MKFHQNRIMGEFATPGYGVLEHLSKKALSHLSAHVVNRLLREDHTKIFK